ncbi:MAG: T9SS type A sorting domain-containing protein [Bacteroidetes bacterium]|nr:T9SS type A sorting domain-containing protein [Bacteroidota bacterium]
MQIIIKEKDFITYSGTKYIIIGKTDLLFYDDAESGISNWTSTTWDTTFMDMQSGSHSVADSRYGNYESFDDRVIELNTQIYLTAATNPMIMFNAKWSLENPDQVTLEVSSDGIAWDDILVFSEHQHWVQQKADLSSYNGQNIYLRFRLLSDASVQSDGFYFDDFRVVDFDEFFTSTAEQFNLKNITIYPNPTMDLININKGNVAEMQIDILHCTGRLILSRSVTDQVTSIDFSKYPPGMYFIKFLHKEKTTVQKIVKN